MSDALYIEHYTFCFALKFFVSKHTVRILKHTLVYTVYGYSIYRSLYSKYASSRPLTKCDVPYIVSTPSFFLRIEPTRELKVTLDSTNSLLSLIFFKAAIISSVLVNFTFERRLDLR